MPWLNRRPLTAETRIRFQASPCWIFSGRIGTTFFSEYFGSLKLSTYMISGPGSSVGIAIGYGLDGLGIEFRWGRDFPHLSRPALGLHPAPYKMGTGSFPGVKGGRSVTLTPHSLLVPWSRKSRAIPLLPLWAVRPVQSLSACRRVHFTFQCLYIHDSRRSSLSTFH